MARIKNLRGPIARVAMAQMIEYLHFGGKLKKNRLSIYSSIVDHDVGYHLAGAVFLPSNYLDAMPSFPVFLEYWPSIWGTVEDCKEKTYVFNPNFVEEIVCMSDESFESLFNEILKLVYRTQYEVNRRIFKILS